MRYDMRDMKQNIYEAELMLRALTNELEELTLINPDSNFTNLTARAVSESQQYNGLPPTGVVDYDTWVRLFEAYERNKNKFKHSQTRIT